MSVNTLTISVSDLETVLLLYDRIQVWKSATEMGVFQEITSEDGSPARLDGTVTGTWVINGQTLTVVLNGTDPVDVDFLGTDPFDLQTVLDQINAVLPDIAEEKEKDSDLVSLVSTVNGTRSSLLVSDTAATTLGLPTTKVNGTDKRIRLAENTEVYTFRDLDGIETDWYKTRFFSTETEQVSAFSAPRQGNPQNILQASDLSTATLVLADPSGEPIVGRRVRFIPVDVATVDASGSLVGILPGSDSLETVTDEQGAAAINLIRGQTYRVVFVGSSYMREFVVPAQPTFDLLALIGNSPDPFDIVQVPSRPIKVTT